MNLPLKENNLPNKITKLTLLLLSSLAVMSGAGLSSTLPLIEDHFAAIPNAGFWVRMLQTTPALFILAAAPLAGVMIDRIGRKRLLVAGVLLYGLAGSSGFFIRSLWGLLAGRALLGVGVAAIYTTTTALVSDYFRGLDRNRFLGLQSGFMAISGVLFQPLGGILADIQWNFTFLIYAAAFVLLPLAIAFIYEPERQVDHAVGSFSGGRLFQRIPALPLVVIFLLTFFGQTIFYVTPVQLPFYLKEINIQSAGLIALFTGGISLMMGLSGLSYGRLRKRLTYRQIVLLSFGLMAAGYLLIGASRHYWVIILGLVISGLGLGLNNPNLISWLVSLAPEEMRGRALGTRLTFNYLGQFMSPILAQPLIAAGGVPAAYLAAAGLGGLIAIASMVLVGTRKTH
ncbi:MFS transporter [bacterium]|nr:MFS transporter [bacterium]